MPINLDNLQRGDIADHLESGSENLIGVTIPVDHFKGKKLSSAVRGWCTLNKWIEHNSPWKVRYEYAFENGAQYRILLFRKSDGQLVKEFPWSAVKGAAISELNFGNFFERLGFRMALKLAKKIENQLEKDGVVFE